jgi:hypothetical protein
MDQTETIELTSKQSQAVARLARSLELSTEEVKKVIIIEGIASLFETANKTTVGVTLSKKGETAEPIIDD